MKRILHTNSGIFFKNPYVISVLHNHINYRSEFNDLLKRVRKIDLKTWGYSVPYIDYNPRKHQNAGFLIDHSVNSYWCFQDHSDALQFRLMVKESKRVFLWSKLLKFTISEFCE